MLRGLYLALGTFLAAAVTSYLALRGDLPRADAIEVSILTGLIPALGALGFRVGVEGRSDAARDKDGDVLPGDVGVRPGDVAR